MVKDYSYLNDVFEIFLSLVSIIYVFALSGFYIRNPLLAQRRPAIRRRLIMVLSRFGLIEANYPGRKMIPVVFVKLLGWLYLILGVFLTVFLGYVWLRPYIPENQVIGISPAIGALVMANMLPLWIIGTGMLMVLYPKKVQHWSLVKEYLRAILISYQRIERNYPNTKPIPVAYVRNAGWWCMAFGAFPVVIMFVVFVFRLI